MKPPPHRLLAPVAAAVLLAPLALAQARDEPAPPDAFGDLDGPTEPAAAPTEPAADRPAGAVATLPPGLDRSAWRLPAGSPVPVDDLSLWDEGCYRCVVADDFEADPLAEPSILAAMESALSTYDE